MSFPVTTAWMEEEEAQLEEVVESEGALLGLAEVVPWWQPEGLRQHIIGILYLNQNLRRQDSWTFVMIFTELRFPVISGDLDDLG